MDLEIEPQERQSPNNREALPVEGLLQQRGLSSRGPSPYACGSCAQPAFVDKDDQPALTPRFFLSPATASVASDEGRARPVPRPGVPAADN
jgi:hypothetical protein